MGLLDLPTPLFAAIDDGLALILGPAWRLMLWAAFGGATAMLIYRYASPQARIAEAKVAARRSRAALNAYDGDIAGAGPLIRRQLGDALRQLRLVLPASLLSLVLLLSLLFWADTRFGHHFPAADARAPALTTVPAMFQADWIDDAKAPKVLVRAADGQTLIDHSLSAPVTVLHHWQWWNLLLANPAGYLPDGAPVQSVHIALPSTEYLPFGPGWARSWLALFIPVLFAVSLAIHRLAGIQ